MDVKDGDSLQDAVSVEEAAKGIPQIFTAKGSLDSMHFER